MYNLDMYNFGELLRKVRKAKSISTEQLAKAINKTTATIYKYERNEIIPDLLTVLEICNFLDINFNDLTNLEIVEETKENSNNPFNVDTLYIYYLGFKRMAIFKLEIRKENGFQKVYFKHTETNKIYFVGTLESVHDIAYITMKNYYATNKKFEKIEIIINLKYTSDDRYMGVIIGTDDATNIPIAKKCILLKSMISENDEQDKKETEERLKISNEEIQTIQDIRFWRINIENKNDYRVIK